ncbi:MAG TPA: hypothetical protein VMW45_04570 [Dehalococcoidia bacterium]|nr:hypothetical protein [Dehalococcoidia bacterium]
MENEEINQRLAEWAGFYLGDIKITYRYWHDKREPCLLCPDGSVSYGMFGRGTVPDFTESLDVCFKWLVPKLVSVDILYGKIDAATVALALKHGQFFSATAETVALAFCRSIEKLIDEGG